MSEISHSGNRVNRGVMSLMKGGNANGLPYNSFDIMKPAWDSDAPVPCNPKTFVTCLSYYPRGVLSGDYMFGHIEGPAPCDEEVERAALDDVKYGDYDEEFKDKVVFTDRTAPIVEFTRRASTAGVLLLESQIVTLREHSAPMAAIAIYAVNARYALQGMTPVFMWPWRALRMMGEDMKNSTNEQ